MKMNLRPPFRYQITNYSKGIGTVFLTLIIIPTLFLITFQSSDPDYSFSFTGFEIVPAIFMFVMGIVAIRSDLRFCLQYGTSRRTVFISEILSVLTASILLAAGAEIIKGTLVLLIGSNPHILVADLYEIIYLGKETGNLTFNQHLISMLFNISLVFSFAFFGMFFSLMFWRLSKAWTVVVAICIPFLFTVVPIGLSKLNINIKPFIDWLGSSPFRFMLICLVSAIVFEIINWLLLRRANIMAAKS